MNAFQSDLSVSDNGAPPNTPTPMTQAVEGNIHHPTPRSATLLQQATNVPAKPDEEDDAPFCWVSF